MLATLALLAAKSGAATVSARFTVDGIIALIAGILILIVPKLLNYIVAAYLIYVGLVSVFNINW
jgi:hypothetical protein